MYSWHLTVGLLFAIATFQTTSAGETQTVEADGVPCIVDAYLHALEDTMQAESRAEDVRRAVSLLDANVVYQHPRAGARIEGREQIAEGMNAFLGATRNGRFEIVDWVSGNGMVAVNLRRNFEAPGNTVEEWQENSVAQFMVFEVVDGSITQIFDYW